jgi:hypothetical protein
MNGQTEYIKLIKSISLVEIQVANLALKSKLNEYKPGYRYNVGKYEIHDERNILMNEIVFDFDWSSYVKNYAKAKLVAEVLENRKIPYYVYATGGKGIHIHIYFNKVKAEKEEHKTLLKEAAAYGFIPKHLRMWFWNLILEEAGIEDKFRGKYVDSKVVKFNYFAGTSHLIRDCGGRKIQRTPEDTFTTTYKTFLTKEDFTKKKISVTEFSNVKFPSEIKAFTFDITEVSAYLTEYVKSAKLLNTEQLNNVYLKTNYTDIDGVLKIREGLGLGNRGMGAFIISVACKIDQLSKTDAKTMLSDYVSKCAQIGHNFTLAEAEQWLDWVYSQEKVYWNCSQLKDIGVHDDTTCEFCLARNRKTNEFLQSTKLLNQVKEVLDYEIIGEENNKMLVFLLLLSKDFPSETGLPGWNIASDPMSQNVILASDSSSGKTYLAKRILRLFGDEDVDYFVISRMSKNVINYYTEINMDRKIIFIEEMQGLDENTSQLRVWMSEGKLKFDTVEKIVNEEGIEVNAKVTKITQGQPCFLTCQAEGKIEDQLNNRSWLVSMDVSEKQTVKILEYQTQLNKNNIKHDKIKIRTIKDALKQLKSYHFIIDFLDEKFMKIPTNDVRARRDYMKFITLIKCSAHLHQKQREIKVIDEKEYIVCDILDYDIARQYSHRILGATFTGLTIQQIDMINIIKDSEWKTEFDVYHLQNNFGKSHSYWHGQLAHLENLGFVTCEKNLGGPTMFRLNMKKALDLIDLPTGTQLLENIELKLKKANHMDLQESEKTKTHMIAPSPVKLQPDFPNKSEDLSLTKNESALFKNVHGKTKHFSSSESRNRLSSEDVLDYIKSHKEHIVQIVDIEEYFNGDVDPIIDKLKKEGTIFEIKPGRVMIS